MSTINDVSYNKVQVNYQVKKNSSDEVLERSTMINIRTESLDEAFELYQSLKRKLNGELSPVEEEEMIDPDKLFSQEKSCARCGVEMKLRTSKNGKNPGSKFWGCLGYPNCRYTEAA